MRVKHRVKDLVIKNTCTVLAITGCQIQSIRIYKGGKKIGTCSNQFRVPSHNTRELDDEEKYY